MRHQGIRRLLVIAGDEDWCTQQALYLTQQLSGHWLWLGGQPELENCCKPAACKTLLGREIRHAIFDARYQLDVQALAVLAGTLVAGSLLVLLIPPWDDWPQWMDHDSTRWNDGRSACATPYFIHHLQHCLQQDDDVLFYRQDHQFTLPVVSTERTVWQPATGMPLPQQQEILHKLLQQPGGVVLVSAARGRGKSALAGMLIANWPGGVLVTAPARIATTVIAVHAGSRFSFIAPDVLLNSPPSAMDWLIIDEAAAFSGAQLQKLIRLYPRTLLTTTVQGYEGTGRGFLLKFCASIADLRHYELTQPIRWALNDPLERIINHALLLDELPFNTNSDTTQTDNYHFLQVSQQRWQSHPQQMAQIYRLLTAAHYRTSPLDLRRMMDAAGQHFFIACVNDQVIAALWLVEEGGLSPAVSQAIWAGVRRPPGNLVAQSLAAHGIDPLAACLKGLRISRIAVHPRYQRQGIGQRLVAAIRDTVAGYAYLSVSFGYTPELWCFWQHCGFYLLRFGSRREASSGCYNMMALYPLDQQGLRLAMREHQALQRDARWLQPLIDEQLPLSLCADTSLHDDDWLTLAGFAFASRPLATCVGALNRLLQTSRLQLPLLRARLQTTISVTDLCQQSGLSGRKALLVCLRQETAAALQLQDVSRCQQLRQYILKVLYSE